MPIPILPLSSQPRVGAAMGVGAHWLFLLQQTRGQTRAHCPRKPPHKVGTRPTATRAIRGARGVARTCAAVAAASAGAEARRPSRPRLCRGALVPTTRAQSRGRGRRCRLRRRGGGAVLRGSGTWVCRREDMKFFLMHDQGCVRGDFVGAEGRGCLWAC